MSDDHDLNAHVEQEPADGVAAHEPTAEELAPAVVHPDVTAVHPSLAEVDDTGKVDFRQQVRDPLGNIVSPPAPAVAPPALEPAPAPVDTSVADKAAAAAHDSAQSQVRMTALSKMLEIDMSSPIAPMIVTVLKMHEATLKRQLPSGNYVVMGPMVTSPQVYDPGSFFDALNAFMSNANRASSNNEARLRAAAVAARSGARR